MPLAVNEQSAAVKEMAAEWPVIDALMAGTRGMRAAGKSLLPQWPNEDTGAYAARLATATLFPAFRRTVGVMAGKPFARQVTLGDDAPERVKGWCQDVDLQGRNLHAFAAGLLRNAISHGICGVLIDYPRSNGARTLADERASGARPYCVHIRHNQVLGWRMQTDNGTATLVQLRLLESVEEPDGDYGATFIAQVRVLEPGVWRTYRADDKGVFQLHEEGVTTLAAIPYVPLYGRRTGFMTGESPLIDLAYLNVEHWQSKSDQQTILHVARVPILAAVGVDETFQMTVGASSAVKLPEGGELKFVEHTGAAIEAGAKSIEALEAQMIQTGAELLVKQPGDRSATEAANDAEGNKSELQSIVEAFEDSIDAMLQFMAGWVGEPEGGHVSLFKDFGAATLGEASGQLIVAMQQAGLLSKATTIREQQRRGLVAADVDPEKELEAVDAEGPPLGTIGQGGGSEDD